MNKKSYCLPWPKDIPDEYMMDFIRGLIDSDGAFHWTNEGYVRLGFSSSTKEFVESFKDYVGWETSIIENVSLEDNKRFTNYAISVGAEKSLMFLDKIYSCPQEMRNEERYLKYVKSRNLWDENHSKICLNDDCERIATKFGLCLYHHIEEEKKNRPICSMDGCYKVSHTNDGLCMEHMFLKKKEPKREWQKEISKALIAMREKNNLRQIDISSAIGMAKTVYPCIERGDRPLPEKYIPLIESIFNIELPKFVKT